MQSSPSSWRSALRAAFPHTIPIFAGFLVLGVTYGMLMQAIGYGPLWSGLFSAIAFGGSTQYAAVPLLAAGFDPLEVFLLSLTISARHLFYSVSMLKKYDDLGWKRWMLYYTLCDETFSVVSTVEPPEGVDAGKFYLSVSLLDWSYWVTASMLGGVLGGVLPFDISGMDFASVGIDYGFADAQADSHSFVSVTGMVFRIVQRLDLLDPLYGADLRQSADREEKAMRLNAIQTLIILLAITVGTVITRFLPPILFPHGKPLPKFLQELCTLLPPAMMGLLLVYSLRNVSFASAGQWLPECIAIAVTAGLHLWRRNSLLSIAGGTITYMLLVQVIFA